jgi:hypothetical protein
MQERSMPFNATQKTQLMAELIEKGWSIREDTIWSPSGGLYFNDSHFTHWGPKEMRDIFTERAARIERSALKNWETSANENRQVSDAAAEVLKSIE